MDHLKHLAEAFPNISDRGLLVAISEFGLTVNFEAGEIITDLGEDVEFLPLVLQGRIHVFDHDADPSEEPAYTVDTGGSCSFVMINCLSGSPSTVKAIAATATTIVAIPSKEAVEWLTRFPEWRRWVLNSFKEKLRSFLDK